MSIVFLDMDKTITLVTTALFLGDYFGVREEVDFIEGLIAAKRISDREFYEGIGECLEGITVESFWEGVREVPVRLELRECIEGLTAKGYESHIVTVGVGPVGHYLCEEYGFTTCYGSSLVSGEGHVKTLGPPFVSVKGKGQYVREVCAVRGVNPKDCAAVGDSWYDKFMMAEVGHRFGIEHDGKLDGHVDRDIRYLTDILDYLPDRCLE
tara:strand:- start:160 stop:789 length:630 start_codon:yes stop_codon:yes gene_type:complete